VPDSLLTELEVAKHLHVSVARVRRWRLERRGLRFLKIGVLARYRPVDLGVRIKCTTGRGGNELVAGEAALLASSGRA
jgi:hypothetical protein